MQRRQFIASAGAVMALPRLAYGQAVAAIKLVASEGRQSLAGPGHPDTAIWGYDGKTPGPNLRFRQGDRLKVELVNRLPKPTTVHWHGLRVPNAMDGVPDVTQKPVEPGASFTYEFDLKDAGTYWYHSHVESFEQLARGLYGAIIVEEPSAYPVERDIVWVLGDFRLDREARIAADFKDLRDATHGGRLGNTVTINGATPETFAATSGERMRLRLINAANARIFALRFEGHAPTAIAFDGQPVDPHTLDLVRIGPGQRVDLILDMTGRPGSRHRVIDDENPRAAYRLVDFVYDDETKTRREVPPPRLPSNPIARPTLDDAQRRRLVFGGGAMDPAFRRRQPTNDEIERIRQDVRAGKIWSVNGLRHAEHAHHEPIFTFGRGATAVVELVNDTAWPHPIHFHGVVFDVLSRNGKAVERRELRDTVLLAPGETSEIAFVAETAGDWMIHCHILEHQESGMMAVMKVV